MLRITHTGCGRLFDGIGRVSLLRRLTVGNGHVEEGGDGVLERFVQVLRRLAVGHRRELVEVVVGWEDVYVSAGGGFAVELGVDPGELPR